MQKNLERKKKKEVEEQMDGYHWCSYIPSAALRETCQLCRRLNINLSYIAC